MVTPRSIRCIFAVMVLVAIAVPAGSTGITVAQAASGMRCGNRLISIGDHKSLVLDRCGDPDFVDQQTIFRTERVTYDGRIWFEIQAPIVLDVWVYDLGPNRFIEYLQFQGSRLFEVATGPYGSKE